jgi:hypothetical protein
VSPDRKAALEWLASLDLKVPKVSLDLSDPQDPPVNLGRREILDRQVLLESQRAHQR